MSVCFLAAIVAIAIMDMGHVAAVFFAIGDMNMLLFEGTAISTNQRTGNIIAGAIARMLFTRIEVVVLLDVAFIYTNLLTAFGTFGGTLMRTFIGVMGICTNICADFFAGHDSAGVSTLVQAILTMGVRFFTADQIVLLFTCQSTSIMCVRFQCADQIFGFTARTCSLNLCFENMRMRGFPTEGLTFFCECAYAHQAHNHGNGQDQRKHSFQVR